MPLGSSRCSRLMLEDMSFPSSAFGFFPSNLRPPLRVFRSFFNVFFFCPRYLSEDSSWKVFVSVRTPEVPSLFFFFLQKPTSHARDSEKNVLRREGCRKRLPLEASLRSTLTFYVDRISLWARLRCSVHHSFPRSSATTTSLPIYSWLMPVYRLRRRQQTPA